MMERKSTADSCPRCPKSYHTNQKKRQDSILGTHLVAVACRKLDSLYTLRIFNHDLEDVAVAARCAILNIPAVTDFCD